jgi:ArsR family metal-binding transcriptional regulator
MNDEFRNLSHWRGKPIIEMTREELITVIVEMGNLMQRQFQSSEQAFRRLRELRDARSNETQAS